MMLDPYNLIRIGIRILLFFSLKDQGLPILRSQSTQFIFFGVQKSVILLFPFDNGSGSRHLLFGSMKMIIGISGSGSATLHLNPLLMMTLKTFLNSGIYSLYSSALYEHVTEFLKDFCSEDLKD